MKEITRDESRKIMLDILKDVASFCDQNGLTYFLSSGTLIGAIRHKGFIPWDDDIDIEMPRPDYDKFIDLYKKYGNYDICSPNDLDSFLFYTKVYDNRTAKIESGIDYSRFRLLGVDIDIFPIDGQPDDSKIDLFYSDCEYRAKLYQYIYISNQPLNLENKKTFLFKLFLRLFDKQFFIKKYVMSASKYDYNNSDMVGFMSPWSKCRNRHEKKVFSDRIKVQFEDLEFWAPIGYDTYLRNLFGDYMKLPPVEQRETHHSFTIYWK